MKLAPSEINVLLCQFTYIYNNSGAYIYIIQVVHTYI